MDIHNLYRRTSIVLFNFVFKYINKIKVSRKMIRKQQSTDKLRNKIVVHKRRPQVVNVHVDMFGPIRENILIK